MKKNPRLKLLRKNQARVLTLANRIDELLYEMGRLLVSRPLFPREHIDDFSWSYAEAGEHARMGFVMDQLQNLKEGLDINTLHANRIFQEIQERMEQEDKVKDKLTKKIDKDVATLLTTLPMKKTKPAKPKRK